MVIAKICIVLSILGFGFSSKAAEITRAGFTLVSGEREVFLRSPDGRFTASSEGGGIFIEDTVCHEKFPMITVNSPLRAMRWSDDSETLVSIEHLAMTDDVELHHFANHRWSHFEADPIRFAPFYKYSVTKFSTSKDKVQVVFVGQGDHGLYEVKFDIRPSDNTYHRVKTRKLEDYNSVKVLGFE